MKLNYKLLILAIVASITHTKAQNQVHLIIDSLETYIRNSQSPDEVTPYSPGHSSYIEPTADFTLIFYINDPSNLNTAVVQLGTEAGKSDSRSWKIHRVSESEFAEEQGNASLVIKKNKIIIRGSIPASVYDKKYFLMVEAADKNNKKSKVLTRVLN